MYNSILENITFDMEGLKSISFREDKICNYKKLIDPWSFVW